MPDTLAGCGKTLIRAGCEKGTTSQLAEKWDVSYTCPPMSCFSMRCHAPISCSPAVLSDRRTHPSRRTTLVAAADAAYVAGSGPPLPTIRRGATDARTSRFNPRRGCSRKDTISETRVAKASHGSANALARYAKPWTNPSRNQSNRPVGTQASQENQKVDQNESGQQ